MGLDGKDKESARDAASEAARAGASAGRRAGASGEGGAEAAEPGLDASTPGEEESGEAAEPGVEEERTLAALEEECRRLSAERDELAAERDRLAAAHQQLRDALARLQADFDNFRRRTREEKARRKQEAAEDIIKDLLPVVDNMERAVRAVPPETGSSPRADGTPSDAREGVWEGLRSGVELILQQLRGVLEKRGVVPAPGVGSPFDPRWHHALAHETGDGESSGAGDGSSGEKASSDAPLVVVEEFQRGYLLGERALRPGLVRVGPAPSPDVAGDSGKGSAR